MSNTKAILLVLGITGTCLLVGALVFFLTPGNRKFWDRQGYLRDELQRELEERDAARARYAAYVRAHETEEQRYEREAREYIGRRLAEQREAQARNEAMNRVLQEKMRNGELRR